MSEQSSDSQDFGKRKVRIKPFDGGKHQRYLASVDFGETRLSSTPQPGGRVEVAMSTILPYDEEDLIRTQIGATWSPVDALRLARNIAGSAIIALLKR